MAAFCYWVSYTSCPVLRYFKVTSDKTQQLAVTTVCWWYLTQSSTINFHTFIQQILGFYYVASTILWVFPVVSVDIYTIKSQNINFSLAPLSSGILWLQQSLWFCDELGYKPSYDLIDIALHFGEQNLMSGAQITHWRN